MSEEQLKTQQEQSVQSRAKDASDSGLGGFGAWLLNQLSLANSLLPPWYSVRRDLALENLVRNNDHLSSATNSMSARIAGIPSRVEARDPTIATHRKLADFYNVIWHETSEFGEGGQNLLYKTYFDWAIRDNGFFLEFIGDGDPSGPIEGPVVGIANLDSLRCVRTGNPEFPVKYTDASGEIFKLHRTRVGFAASMPSTREEMFGVGFSAASRCSYNAQHLTDIGTYEAEKLGSRPKRQILITQGGLDPDDVANALDMADSKLDNQGLSRFGKNLLLGDATLAAANIVAIDLASTPDGFDKQASTTLGMFAIALAFGVPVRWLWPATAAGATKADAMFQHIAGQGPGVGFFLSIFTNILAGSPQGKVHIGGKFLPPTLRLIFDFQDDEQDRIRAENRKQRGEGWKIHTEMQTMDVRAIREQMLRAGDLTDAQFERLELEDGRLPNGQDVLTLFNDTDPLFIKALDLGVTNPLSIALHDPTDMIVEIDAAALVAQDMVVNAISAQQKQKASFALSALGKLKGMYTEILTQQIQAERLAQEQEQIRQGQKPQPKPEEEKPEEDTQEGLEEAAETKQFDFGAGVGEIIGGQLARGAGGRFVSAAELSASLRADIIAKIRGRAGEDGELSKAELKRQANREAVAEELGITGLDVLGAMRGGEQPTPEQTADLAKRGLVEVQDDGTVIMSSAGRGLMNAANAGDRDAAKAALAKATKPKKPKGGKGGKSPEDRKREKREQQRKNRIKIQNRISDDVLPDDFNALTRFNEGQPLDSQTASNLAKSGLVEFDVDGNPRLTTNGRALASAADKGDVRKAQDAISKAKDRMAKNEEKLDKLGEQSDNLDDKADEVDDKIADIESQIAELPEDAEPEDIEALNERAERFREQAARLREQAEGKRESAEQLRQKIGLSQTKEVSGFFVPFDDLITKDGLSSFRLGVRNAVRSLWNGSRDEFEFEADMGGAIRRRLTQAWFEGAAKAGIAPDELTEEEVKARDELIDRQIEFLPDFTDWLLERTKAEGYKLTPLLVHAEMWINRYGEAKEKAFVMASGNKKLTWFYSPEKQHCSDCEKYHLKTYRAKTWAKWGIFPKMWHLECRGIHCGCETKETNRPITPGRPPSPSN